MLATLRDLLVYNPEFRIGAILVSLVAGMATLSLASPYAPLDTFVVAPDMPPSFAHPFGTTSRGQDVFWLLTFAIRNTLAFGILVAVLSRFLSLAIGLLAGYKGGWVDRQELRFYGACFIMLCSLVVIAILSPVAAAAVFVLIAGSAHLLWRAFI